MEHCGQIGELQVDTLTKTVKSPPGAAACGDVRGHACGRVCWWLACRSCLQWKWSTRLSSLEPRHLQAPAESLAAAVSRKRRLGVVSVRNTVGPNRNPWGIVKVEVG